MGGGVVCCAREREQRKKVESRGRSGSGWLRLARQELGKRESEQRQRKRVEIESLTLLENGLRKIFP